jgi:MFS family permease
MSGGLATAIVLVTTTLNAGVHDWTEAQAIATPGIAILFALPTLGLVTGGLLGRHWYPIKPIPRRVTETIEVHPGDRVSWVGRARVRGVALVVFGLAVLLLFLRPGLPLWVFVLVAGVGVVFSQVEAQVTNDGMSVRFGGLPVRTFHLELISSARAIEVDPAGFGGRGWKKIPGQQALILRPGEAIALTFRDGDQFVITVDDAATGAALLNGLIELRG